MTETEQLAARVLGALQAAVSEALDRKKRLGQYAVVVRDGKVVRLIPPANPADDWLVEDEPSHIISAQSTRRGKG